MKILSLILILMIPFLILSQSNRNLSFQNDCWNFELVLDGSKYTFYSTGGGNNGPIIETGYIELESGQVIHGNKEITLNTTPPFTEYSIIGLTLKRVLKPLPNKYYFQESLKSGNSNEKKTVFWEIENIENKELYKKIILGEICDN